MSEISRLALMLCELDIDFSINSIFDTPQIVVGDYGDVVSHPYSMGGREGLLETMGFGQDDCEGYLVAEEALGYIVADILAHR